MAIMDDNQTKDTLRYALNELKAIGTSQQNSRDSANCAIRLRNLASHIESGGSVPDIEGGLLREAINLPVQA